MQPQENEPAVEAVDPHGPGVDQTPGAYDVLPDGEYAYTGDDAPTDRELAKFPSAKKLIRQANRELGLQ